MRSKRAISKHFFHWDPSPDYKVYDQRLVDESLANNKSPEESGLDYRAIDTKILVYEDSVKEWFLEIAKRLKDDNEAGFVILQIAISYIEGNQQYREGKLSLCKSQPFFIKSMKRIFPELINIKDVDSVLKKFYDQVRCGLFHDGMVRQGVTISREFSDPLHIYLTDIEINPYKFLERIDQDFNNYINQLKDVNNSILRKNFELIMNMVR